MKPIIETQLTDKCKSFLGGLEVQIYRHIYYDGTYDEIVVAFIGKGTGRQRTIVEDSPIDDFAHAIYTHGVKRSHVICQLLVEEYYQECCEIEADSLLLKTG